MIYSYQYVRFGLIADRSQVIAHLEAVYDVETAHRPKANTFVYEDTQLPSVYEGRSLRGEQSS